MIRWSLSQALSQEGYEVITVENGKKAIDIATTQHFDFIIIDLVMPELDGWKVLEAIRNAHISTRVIIITAHGKEETEKLAKEKGVWAYVEKPYVIEKIKKLIKGSSCDSNNLFHIKEE